MPPGTYGTIWVSDSGQPYKARARYRDFDGTVSTVARFGQTKTAAKNALLEALRDRYKAAKGSHITHDTKVADLADRWLERGHDAGGRPWSNNTRDTYAYVVANQVKPALGNLRVGELRLSTINRALSTIEAKNGPGVAKTTKTVLSGMCRLAIAYEALDGNPVRDAIPIRRAPREAVRALTRDEADDLCDRLRADERAVLLDLPDLVEWMLGTGCRIGEALAARDTVIGRASGTWEINATLIRVTGEGLRIQNRPKTAAGWRVLALPPYMLALLERRDGELRIHGPEGVVFGSPHARSLRDPSNTAGDLREVLDRLGYPWVHSHTFRKTVATRLDEARLSAREIADQLGHRRPSITLDTYMGRAVVSARAASVLDR